MEIKLTLLPSHTILVAEKDGVKKVIGLTDYQYQQFKELGVSEPLPSIKVVIEDMTTKQSKEQEQPERVSMADLFKRDTKNKYYFDASYKPTVGPETFATRRVINRAHVQYRIKFIDGSEVACIMNVNQRFGLERSKWWDSIRGIGGLGYVVLIKD